MNPDIAHLTANPFAGFVFAVIERDHDPECEAEGKKQDADHLSAGSRQEVAEDLEHVEWRHEGRACVD